MDFLTLKLYIFKISFFKYDYSIWKKKMPKLSNKKEPYL